LREDNNHIKIELIIGALMYKKLNKPIEAYPRLVKFLNLTSGSDNYLLLRIKSKEDIREIDNIIEVN
jgi:hypothetical protein